MTSMSSANSMSTIQCYQSNIVVDFEWTGTPKETWRNGLRQEIIEVGAVKVFPDGAVVDTFARLVCPEIATAIDPCVRKLTGIQDCDVCEAAPFSQVMEEFFTWIGQGPVRMVAWSDNDQRQFEKECRAKGVEVPSQLRRWMDLQTVYPRVMGINYKRHLSLEDAAGWYGIEVDSASAHRALYDARVTSEFLVELLTGGFEEHRLAMQQAMGRLGSHSCTTNIGSACSALAELRARLEAAA